MSFGSIVLSYIFQSRISPLVWVLCSCNVLVVAPLALRNFVVFKLGVSRYNKRKQCAPSGAGRGKPRRCCGR
jgi:hypothetical protein